MSSEKAMVVMAILGCMPAAGIVGWTERSKLRHLLYRLHDVFSQEISVTAEESESPDGERPGFGKAASVNLRDTQSSGPPTGRGESARAMRETEGKKNPKT
jgi:hypothetical protein